MMSKELLVREYDELRDFLTAFADGHYELLVLLGDSGTGKSEEARRILQRRLGDQWGLLTGYHTDLDLYKELYRYRYYPVEMDDIDPLFDGNIKTALLKAVCDTKPVKMVEWGSTHRAFNDDENGLPNKFESISRVMIIANELKTLTKNLGAILDRGPVIRFQPGAMNLHVEVAAGGWFDDNEVFREIGKYLYLMVHPSFRFYLTARANKRAGLDWKAILLRQLESDPDDSKLILAAKILNDPRYKTPMEQEQAFIAHPEGGSQATWYRKKREIKEKRGDINMAIIETMDLVRCDEIDPYTKKQLERRKELEAERDAVERNGKAVAEHVRDSIPGTAAGRKTPPVSGSTRGRQRPDPRKRRKA
jgi:hypothetical protein